MTLRKLLDSPDGLHAPGCFDAFSAALIERAGFAATYLSGASIAYTQLGRPDIGLVSVSEVADVLRRIRERVAIPIIADADTGFGNALNVQRTVRTFEQAGANAIQLEDQTLPKRCGHLRDKTLVTPGEMEGKIRAALDARHSAETLIVARTDAIAVEGFEAALERAERYLAAGADVLFVEAPTTIEQMQAICQAFAARVPLVANMVEGGKTPLLPCAELAAMGFRLVLSPGVLMRAITPVMEQVLARLREEGSSVSQLDRMLTVSQLNERLELADMLEASTRYKDAPE